MDELEIVLASYRDMFGVKTDRANEIHKAACIEVARLQAAAAERDAVKKLLAKWQQQHDETDELDIQAVTFRVTLEFCIAELAAALEQR